MPKTRVTTVAEYIGAQPPAARATLRRVRAVVRKAAPRAVEGISYQIPAYKLEGYPVIFFAAWKKHYSLYPISKSLASSLEKELAPYEVDRATIRFPWDAPVPVRVIARIVKCRVGEARARLKIRPSSRRA